MALVFRWQLEEVVEAKNIGVNKHLHHLCFFLETAGLPFPNMLRLKTNTQPNKEKSISMTSIPGVCLQWTLHTLKHEDKKPEHNTSSEAQQIQTIPFQVQAHKYTRVMSCCSSGKGRLPEYIDQSQPLESTFWC